MGKIGCKSLREHYHSQDMKVRGSFLFATVVFILMASWPSVHAQETNNLRQRITDYWSSRPCTSEKCKNPILVVKAHWIQVIRFDGGYHEEYIKLDKLSKYLQDMPLSAWPKGPYVWVRESDSESIPLGETDEGLGEAKKQNMKSVAEVCSALGLTRTNQDGSPYEQDATQ
jgi:hypothetical protein